MAKLSARGRKQLVSAIFRKPDRIEDGWIDNRVEYRLMSDGSVLKKQSGKMKCSYAPSGYKPHTWGWKTTPLKYKELTLDLIAKIAEDWKSKGGEVTID